MRLSLITKMNRRKLKKHRPRYKRLRRKWRLFALSTLIPCVIYLGGITWGTKGGTQGNNVIMGWAIVINNVVNPYHVRDPSS